MRLYCCNLHEPIASELHTVKQWAALQLPKSALQSYMNYVLGAYVEPFWHREGERLRRLGWYVVSSVSMVFGLL